MRTQTVFGVLVVLAALSAPAIAAENIPDPNTQREFSAKLKVCEACHGENGIPKNATIPVILGQQESYVAKQLHDFRSGDRAIEVMKWMADSLSPEEIEPAAVYFANKNWPARSGGGASTPAPSGIAVCQACHQQDFLGAVQAEGMATPRLAGQSYEYLVEEMRRFAEGERNNNPVMAKLMEATSPADREAMARYLSGL